MINKKNQIIIKNALLKKFIIYPNSLRLKEDLIFFIVKDKNHKYFGVMGSEKKVFEYKFSGRQYSDIKVDKNDSSIIRLFSRNETNLKILTKIFPELLPVPIGIGTSFGFGDRLGSANAAHIRLIKRHKDILPVLAQQSVRELEKTGKYFKTVISNSIWNIMQEGYFGKWAADADHIKDKNDFIKAADARMTIYTLDTSEHLDEEVLTMDFKNMKENYNFDSDYIKNMLKKYLNKRIIFNEVEVFFDHETIIRLALVYGKALNFTREIFLLLSSKLDNFDYEVSFDETNTITTPGAHYFLANEMLDSGVRFTSLALRYPGTFEKGIDYIGNIKEFERSIQIHSSICMKIGGYKLSLHSGSDKFSIYPSFAQYTKGIFHIKTSGTSWLEAIRLIALVDPLFFKKLFRIAYDTFDENKKAYHVGLYKKSIPSDLNEYHNSDLPDILDNKDLRRVFHIAYGAILKKEREKLYKILFLNEEIYYEMLLKNFKKHFKLLRN